MIWDKIEKRNNGDLSKWTYTSLFEQGYEANNKKEITYYSCVDILSKSIAKCPLQVKRETEKGEVVEKKHCLYEKLRLRPNPYMNAIDCMKAFVALSIVKGMSGLYINKDKSGRIEGLYPVEISNITIDNMGLIKNNRKNKILYDFYMLSDNNLYSCFEKDIILLKGYTEDGINADSITKILSQNLNTSIKSQEYLNKLFSNGLTNKIAVQLTSDIKEEKELKKIQSKFDRIYSSNGRVFTIPAGYSVNTLDLKLADAQFEQLRRLSKEEIAGALGVPLSKLGFMKENAKSEEQDNLKFYTDTLLVYFEQIEQEMDWKLLTDTDRKKGYKIRSNTNVLLRTDSKTQAEVINSYVRNGVYDLDMARGILGVKKLGGEPIITLPSGQVLLKDLLAGNVSYLKNKFDIEGGEKDEQKEGI
ncbi:phage portal protein [Clostridium sporogenes]|uniref:phage portal protein n=1 Tax=Clostridium sporogenes TaxID=1509 RepID=UPI0013D83557|nr:phage portal protein [Clostridium sporogenes]NFL75360.1 phage portal protein [Clostridium sporogenes]